MPKKLKGRLTPIALALGLSTSGFAATPVFDVEVAATYKTFVFDEGAAEIVAYDPDTKRLFVTNGNDKSIDVIDAGDINLADKTMPLLFQIDLSDFWNDADGANSVAANNGLIAAAVENEDGNSTGRVMFFYADLEDGDEPVCQVDVGVLPDMVTFTPDGTKALIANEGEPTDSGDPEGSISVVDVEDVENCSAETADFNDFDGQATQLRASGVRLFPDVEADFNSITVSEELEPEYVAVSPDGKTAWVTLQEANSVAVVDIDTATVEAIVPLGVKRHQIEANGFDASDRDDKARIRSWPVYGMYMPDSIASYESGGVTYYVTANEGDDRGDADEDARGDAVRLKDIADVISFDRNGIEPTRRLAKRIDANLGKDEFLGRLTISSIDGLDDEGRLDKIHAYGARSFSIWGPNGLVFDSGAHLEKITRKALPEYFNSDNDDNDSFDTRSDAKGPEPEAIAVGTIEGRTYAFVGLERVGGISIYDVTNPAAPRSVLYFNVRDFEVDAKAGTENGTVGDLGPEGIVFIPADESPEPGTPMLAVANEISGTTSLYRLIIRD